MGSERAFGDLEFEGVEGDAIVVSNLALFLQAENFGEINTGDGDEGCAFLFGLAGEAIVVIGDEDLAQEGIGGCDVGDARQRQFRDCQEVCVRGRLNLMPG
jgi:hypothetical protein